ncbi:MAG: succinate-semialdehyde dehydrogenase (NADP(+)) [Rickettsiales bacterium]|nr:succinate-semialdehyde dehydrogenase (NADP(+)) [Rickettsiales bacterium]|tara:strand:+ start:10634 stop:12061 length:1428 start_codon:yes stop_codon:yes gene_type:complete
MLKSVNYNSLVNGEWVNGNSKFGVFNPANQSLIGEVFDVGKKGAETAIISAQRAFSTWSLRTSDERANILMNWFNLILKNREEISKIITLESGKPIGESLIEVEYGASFIKWFAEQAKRIKGNVLSTNDNSKRMLIYKQPIGVVSAITPWNFPLAMITRKASAALAAGCTVVLKPSELTPITANRIAELSLEAGFPKGIFNVINGNPLQIGEVMSTHKFVKKITFTGSTKVGKYLMKNASDSIKGISLELGGNAPFVIFDDADLNDSVEGFILCKFRNAGQTCISANRLFVHEKIYDTFMDKLTKRIKNLTIDDGLKNPDIGPLISEKAILKIEDHIQDAISKGAKILIGGKKSSKGKFFFEPSVIINVSQEMKVFKEENFGPIIPVIKFSTDEEVVNYCNSTNYGLAAYFFTKNQNRIWKFSENLEYGMFGINTGKISTYQNPFGGWKESGIGREGSEEGLEPFLEKKFVNWKI